MNNKKAQSNRRNSNGNQRTVRAAVGKVRQNRSPRGGEFKAQNAQVRRTRRAAKQGRGITVRRGAAAQEEGGAYMRRTGGVAAAVVVGSSRGTKPVRGALSAVMYERSEPQVGKSRRAASVETGNACELAVQQARGL